MNKKVLLNNYLNEKNKDKSLVNGETSGNKERDKDKEKDRDRDKDRDRERERSERKEKPQVAVLKQSAQHVKQQRLKEKNAGLSSGSRDKSRDKDRNRDKENGAKNITIKENTNSKSLSSSGSGSSSSSNNKTISNSSNNGSNVDTSKKKPITSSTSSETTNTKKRMLPSKSSSSSGTSKKSSSNGKKREKSSNLKKVKLSNGGVVTKYKKKKSRKNSSDDSDNSDDSDSDSDSDSDDSSGSSYDSDDSSSTNSDSSGGSSDSGSYDSDNSDSRGSFSSDSECDNSDCSCGKKRKMKVEKKQVNLDDDKVITTEYIQKHLSSGKAMPDYSDIAVLIQKSRNKRFIFISKNVFLERTEKILDEIDDIDICSCTIESGCGEECLNRKSIVECNAEHCELGKKCTNQRFQRKQYANIKPAFTGVKGWGLIANSDIKKKDFIMEYCGEVISKTTCLERMKEAENEKFFYFLTLDSKECLDASRRGNLARFMNHSCDPNCETQKWNVGGEVKIGIFAIKPIERGTELTFDYNYERFGAQKQECYCGSKNCRGYLGQKVKSSAVGSSLNSTGSTVGAPRKSSLRFKNSLTFDHKNHVKYFLNEKIQSSSSSLYNCELSAEMELQLINSKRIFLHRNVRKLKSFYLNIFNSFSGLKKLDNNNNNSNNVKQLKRKNKISEIFNV